MFTLNNRSGEDDFLMYTFGNSFLPNTPLANAFALESVLSESVH